MLRRRRVLLLAFAVGSWSCGRAGLAPLPLAGTSRLLVIAAHPDDETIAAGGLIARLAARGAAVEVVFATDGDGWPWAVEASFGTVAPTAADFRALGVRRRAEARAAAAALGLAPGAIRFLGFPDGGLAELWTGNWSPSHPYTSPFTARDRPPPGSDSDLNARYDGEDLLAALTRRVEAFQPDLIAMPHPGDVHPDHAQLGRFVARAVAAGGPRPRPAVIAYLVHHVLWPPAARGGDDPLPPPDPDPAPPARWRSVALSAAERSAKAAALAAHASQLAASADLLRRFLRPNELFAEVDGPTLAELAAERGLQHGPSEAPLPTAGEVR